MSEHTPEPPKSPFAGFDIEPKAIWQTLWHHRRMIAAATFFATALAAVVSGIMPRKYLASATIHVEDSITVGQFRELQGDDARLQDRMPLINTVLRSKHTLGKVLAELGEVTEQTSPREFDMKLAALGGQISAWNSGSQLITVRMQGTKPFRVYRALQLTVDTMVQEILRPKRESLKSTNEFLEGQVERARLRLDEIESERRTLLGDNPDNLPEIAGVNLQNYQRIRTELVTEQGRLQAKKSERAAVGQRVRDYDPGRDGLEDEIARLEAEVAGMQARYTPNHHKLVSAEARLRNLREKLSQTKKSSDSRRSNRRRSPEQVEYQSLSAEIQGLERTIAKLEAESQDLLKKVQSTTDLERRIDRVERDLEVAAASYSNLLAKYEDARVNRELAIYDEERLVWVVEAPQMPTKPGGISRAQIVLGAFFGGTFFGIFVAFLVDFIRGRIRSIQSLRKAVGADMMILELPEQARNEDGRANIDR